MKVIADTNILVRAVTGDNPQQSQAATRMMIQATSIFVTRQVLCELVWVLDRSYGVSRSDIASTIRQLRDTRNVVLDTAATQAGLAVLEAGGDFADGVIAYEGAWMGGEIFASFDKKATELLQQHGYNTHLL